MAKRAPCVDMRTDVHKDERFACLADVAGFAGGRYEAIGRMHALYSWCVDRKLKDAPEDSDGYVVSSAVVCRFLGQSGVMALLAEGCDELALGREFGLGRYYLRGTSEYVSAIRGLNRSATAGGLGRVANAPRKGGQFVADTTITPAVDQLFTSDSTAVDQRLTSGPPAVTSVSPLSSLLKEEEVQRASPPLVLSGASDPKPKHEPKGPVGFRDALNDFHQRYLGAYGAAPSWKGAPSKNLSDLVREHGVDEVRRRIAFLFTYPPKWLTPPFDMGVLKSQFDKLVPAGAVGVRRHAVIPSRAAGTGGSS